jgi:ribosomal protein L7Ae-like RNA K-turn-binding protein
MIPKNKAVKPVERLFPFVLRSRILVVGRETLWRSRSKLHFVLVTEDISDNSLQEILKDFAPYPVVQKYVSEDLEKHFGLKNAKVIGFRKSGLAQSLYAEMKERRLNKPSDKRSGESGLKEDTESS